MNEHTQLGYCDITQAVIHWIRNRRRRRRHHHHHHQQQRRHFLLAIYHKPQSRL